MQIEGDKTVSDSDWKGSNKEQKQTLLNIQPSTLPTKHNPSCSLDIVPAHFLKEVIQHDSAFISPVINFFPFDRHRCSASPQKTPESVIL